MCEKKERVATDLGRVVIGSPEGGGGGDTPLHTPFPHNVSHPLTTLIVSHPLTT